MCHFYIAGALTDTPILPCTSFIASNILACFHFSHPAGMLRMERTETGIVCFGAPKPL